MGRKEWEGFEGKRKNQERYWNQQKKKCFEEIINKEGN